MPACLDWSAWIDLVIARAPDLRKAGVIAIGPDSAQFAPYIEPLETDAPTGQFDQTEPDYLHDPASYADGVVPGYTIEKFKDLYEE